MSMTLVGALYFVGQTAATLGVAIIAYAVGEYRGHGVGFEKGWDRAHRHLQGRLSRDIVENLAEDSWP